jgi:DNA-binding transcriptional regulator YiaG
MRGEMENPHPALRATLSRKRERALMEQRALLAQSLLLEHVMTAMELRLHRLELGYSIHVLAEILAVNSARLQAWETGEEPIRDADDLDAAFRALRHARRNVWPSIEVTASGRSEAR